MTEQLHPQAARVVLAAAGAVARGPGARTLKYPITAPSTRSACP